MDLTRNRFNQHRDLPNQILPISVVQTENIIIKIMSKNQKIRIKKKRKSNDFEREAFALVGRRGGNATVKKYGKKHMSSIGKLGAKKRWGKVDNSKN